MKDCELSNRNNIVDRFYNNMSVLTISNESNEDVIIFRIPDFLEIKRYPKENKYTFSMCISGSSEEVVHNNGYGYYNKSSNGLQFVNKPFSCLVEVMRYTNGNFKMVSTSSDKKWIEVNKIMIPGGNGIAVDTLTTTLDMEYNTLPLTEEEHFQLMTINDGLILDLEYCLKVKKIIDFIDSIGCIISVNSYNNMKISLLFKERLSGGG